MDGSYIPGLAIDVCMVKGIPIMGALSQVLPGLIYLLVQGLDLKQGITEGVLIPSSKDLFD
jgi:hypothetical protein